MGGARISLFLSYLERVTIYVVDDTTIISDKPLRGEKKCCLFCKETLLTAVPPRIYAKANDVLFHLHKSSTRLQQTERNNSV